MSLNEDIIIRPFRFEDVDALVRIAEVSFAEEMSAQGLSPEGFTGQVRMVTRGRMIPFRILSRLTGIKWGLFVAEVDGEVVGCGAYLGRQQIQLANLMVHPDFRRRGIGQALLVRRLEHLAQEGYESVTTTVLASNEASLGNLRKQGFEEFDRYSFFEASLPLLALDDVPTDEVISRPVHASDRPLFEALEKEISTPGYLQIQGSAGSSYFPSASDSLLGRFSGDQQWVRVFEREGNVVGFLAATASANSNKGSLFRPVISDENIRFLTAMLQDASSWMAERGKSIIQIAVPEDRPEIANMLRARGWVQSRSWIRLVKWLKG